MALANYTDLVAALASWLNRSDLTAVIPDMITLAENEFNRVLRVPEMERRATATLSGEAVAVPTDYLSLRSMRSDNADFKVVSAEELLSIPADQTGSPYYVAVIDEQFFFRPSPSSGTIQIVYYQRIPGLTVAAPTNWLMTRHPDLYLFAALAQAEFYTWDDDRLPLVKSRVEEIMGQIMGEVNGARYGGRRLVQQSSVAAISGVAA
jgi:hypothetical protein